MKTKISRYLRRVVAGLRGFVALVFLVQHLAAQQTGPQQLALTALRGSTDPTHFSAQFNAVQSDTAGNLYLLLDQEDGVRLLKTDPTAANILAEAQLGAQGDVGLAMAIDPSGNLYITGTTTSGSITATPGAAFSSASDSSTNVFIGKFDPNLNPLFVTYAGSGHLAVTGIAATNDSVFITGSIFSSTLPVTASSIVQSPASGSFQNGFVERFNAAGTTLIYATYLSGQNGDTAPAAIAADVEDNAYITGFTTSSGYPTLSALVPTILGTTSGFLTRLAPAADKIIFSTFIPGPGITSIAIDPSAQNLLLSGSVALGQFPVAMVSTPLVNITYQTLLRLSLDGSAVISSTILAPGTESALTPGSGQGVWVAGTLTAPASLLPLTPLSTIGNGYAVRVTSQNVIDQTIRFGGVAVTNPTFASAPVALTSLTTNPSGEPIFAGSVSPTASASLLATQTYDLALYNSPTAALSSTLRAAALLPGSCNGSLCAGSAAYLAELNPNAAAPSLALSSDDNPNLVLRNLGSTAATNLQLTANNFTLAHNCPGTIAPGAECEIALTSTSANPGTLTVQADNAAAQTLTLSATTKQSNPIVFSPRELDFGIVTSTSPPEGRTLTLTNLTSQTQTFTSALGSNQRTPYAFTASASTCPSGANDTYSLAPNATCTLTLTFTASSSSTDDGFAQSAWLIGTDSVLLTAYSQANSLALSADEIDFGTQFGTTPAAGPRLPRFLYLSNSSSSPITHSPINLDAPFTLTDRCPAVLSPHSICQMEITYQSQVAPSADSTTLTLDDGLTALITGSTLPPPTGAGQSINPDLTVTPSSINFANAVLVTSASTTSPSVTIENTGAQPFAIALAVTGDFTYTTDCPATLASGAACTVFITFAPSQPGTRQGLLSVTAGSNSTPAYVNLSGTGSAIVTVNNNTLTFGDVLVGQPAVQWYKISSSFTALTATTSSPDFKAILVEDTGYGHGNPPSSAFLSTFAGSCINCWLGVQFIPSTIGPENATLTLTSAVSGSPSPLDLNGTGLALTGLVLAPNTQDFGSLPVHSSSAPVLFMLTNLTDGSVTLSSPTITGDFTLPDPSLFPTGGATCSGILAPGSSCFVNVSFTPTSIGPSTGTLTIRSSNFPVNASLTGYGNPDPGVSVNPAALIFKNVPGPTATAQTITVTNTSSTTLQISSPANATENFGSTSTCSTLAPAATCTITVTFSPTSSLVSDALQIPVAGSPSGDRIYTVPLTGAYTTEDAGLQIIPDQVNYGPAVTGASGAARQFTINNLTAKSLTLSVSIPRQFIVTGSPCAALAPNASCRFSLSFLPLTNGDITGTLFAQATPTDGSATINGLSYVEGYGVGNSTLAITGNIIPGQSLLDFGQVSSGQSSSQTLTLSNQGSTPLTVRRITSEWPFLVAGTTCGATLAINQACTVTIAYTPLNQTANGTPSAPAATDTGTLVIESDSTTGPDLIDLTGTTTGIAVTAPDNTAPLVSYTVSQSSLTFPVTQIGNGSVSQSVTLSNTGTTAIHITAIQTTPDFAFQSNCTTLLPAGSCTILVTFTPRPAAALPDSGDRASALEITSDASNALDFISLFGSTYPNPLTLSPLSLDFGSVQVGDTATLPFQVTNTGTSPAAFTGISTTSGFTDAGDCPTAGGTLAPSTSCTLQVSFAPSKTGAVSGSLDLVTSVSPIGLIASLTGTGIQSNLQVTPSSLNFGSIAIGASATRTLTLTNVGTAPVNRLALALTGDFAVTVPCASSTLDPGATCQVAITFAPTSLGPRNSILTITSSDANSPMTVPLIGAGVANGAFLLTVNDSTSASVSVASEYPATYNLELTPVNNYSGTVVLACTAVNPAPYANCSLLPSSITLSGTQQNAVAIINTITTIKPGAGAVANKLTSSFNPANTVLCLLPGSLLLFWSRRVRIQTSRLKHLRSLLLVMLITAITLWQVGCGGGGNPNIRSTPPGNYQYQITASSTTGVQLAQSVTLNLVVTAH
jgi:hypothetical protein